MKKRIVFMIGLCLVAYLSFSVAKRIDFNPKHEVGEKLDSLNGVYVYYNGAVANVEGRNLAPDGYNLGLKYQCVEFVKRYYYEALNHKMPDSYGHAKSFFNTNLKDGAYNKQRNLIQYSNPSKSKPEVNDLLVFSGTIYNQYGHVAIVSKVEDDYIEIIQQNPGPTASSRINIPLKFDNDTWQLEQSDVLGWLRK